VTACPHCGIPQQRPLTKRQAEVLAYLDNYIQAHNYAPTFAEIAAYFDFGSLGTVHEHLRGLEQKGRIVRRYNEARSIQIVEVG
jgi:repressor LexA